METKKEVEWQVWKGSNGQLFFWHPDDEPPQNSTQMDEFKPGKTGTLELKPKLELQHGVLHRLDLVWSGHQSCYFLRARGVDNDGMPLGERVSVNLLPDYSPAWGYLYCQTNDYRKVMVAALVDRGILVPTEHEVKSEFIQIPLFKCTLFGEQDDQD